VYAVRRIGGGEKMKRFIEGEDRRRLHGPLRRALTPALTSVVPSLR